MIRLNSLLDKISKDKDVVYRVSSIRGNSSMHNHKLAKELTKEYGKTAYRSTTSGVKSVNTNKYIVKPATEKNKKKQKYKDPLYKYNRRRFTLTNYYVY